MRTLYMELEEEMVGQDEDKNLQIDPSKVLFSTISLEDLSKISCRISKEDSVDFTIWTQNRVYFPTVFDFFGDEIELIVRSVPRNPSRESYIAFHYEN